MKWKKYKVAITIIAVFLIVASGTAIIAQQSVLGEPSVRITQFGIIKAKTFTQEIFNTDKPGTCRLDDQRFSICSATKNYGGEYGRGSLGEGASHYWGEPWGEKIKSCAGFLNYYGCYETFAKGNCEIIDGGTCPGDPHDSDSAECSNDYECAGGYTSPAGLKSYCLSGKCTTTKTGDCSNGVYRCTNGEVYRCGLDQAWKWYGGCTYLDNRKSVCVVNDKIGTDPYELCVVDEKAPEYEKTIDLAREKGWTAGDILCQKNTDCKGSASCVNGLCSPDIIIEGTRCSGCGGQPRPPTELPSEGDPCTIDYNYKCPETGQIITPAKCINQFGEAPIEQQTGVYHLTGEKCQPKEEVDFWEVLWENNKGWFIAGFLGVALIIILLVTK